MATTTKAPPRATGRRNHGRTHSYRLDGQSVMGVTEILGKGLPKPALTAWAARETANFVADNLDMLKKLQRDEIVDLCKGAPFRERDRAAGRGTEVHRLAHAIASGQTVDVPEELVGHVDSYLGFLDAWQPADELTELSIYSRRWRYGGTLDLLCMIQRERIGRALIDLKTNRSGPFGDTALQLAGYKYADFMLDADGREQPMPTIDWCGVLWVRADGADLYPYDVTDEEFRQFLYCMRTAQWLAERGDGRSMRPVRGEALMP